MTSSQLFLDIIPVDKMWKILDNDKNIIGEGDQPEEAIKQARETSNADITTLTGAIVTQNVPDDLIPEHEIIETLAEIAGMKVTKIQRDDFSTAGYTMELIE